MEKGVELEKGERDELLFLMAEYREKGERIEEVQRELERLREEWQSLESELERARERERSLVDRLTNKYGRGSLDPDTLKFYPGADGDQRS